MKEINNRLLVCCTVFACITGICLRIASFSWNKTLNGDVNLFALTAREFALHGQFDYPMKYEFSDQVAYLTLHTPASQHPPLWPFLAGVISKISNNDDTFSILKVLSEITGLLLIGVIACIIRYVSSGYAINLVAVSLASLSAILIDFSANGSPYILMALWLTLSTWLLLRFEPQKFTHLLCAGILCASSFLTHSALLLLPLGFLYAIWTQKTSQEQTSQLFTVKSRLLQMALFLLVILLGLSPWLIWNMQQFRQIFHSNSSNYIFDQLGLLHTGIFNDVITSRLEVTLPAAQILQSYISIAGKSIYALCREFALLIGPFGLILIVIGLYQGFKTNKAHIISLLLPTLAYLAAIGLWATYKFRYLAPIMPAFSLLAALGFMALFNQGKVWRWLAGICLAGAFVWCLFPIIHGSKTLYYGQDSLAHDALYAEMQPLASSLANRDQGVVLGYAQSLDGGIETVYWHRFPFVAGRGMGEMEIKKLASDFKIRYIWADTSTITSLQQWLPAARLIDQSGSFSILELPD